MHPHGPSRLITSKGRQPGRRGPRHHWRLSGISSETFFAARLMVFLRQWRHGHYRSSPTTSSIISPRGSETRPPLPSLTSKEHTPFFTIRHSKIPPGLSKPRHPRGRHLPTLAMPFKQATLFRPFFLQPSTPSESTPGDSVLGDELQELSVELGIFVQVGVVAALLEYT